MTQLNSLRKSLLLVLALLFIMPILAQEEDGKKKNKKEPINYEEVKDKKNFGRFRVIDFRMHTGVHIYGGEGLNEKLDQGYGGTEIRYGWQTDEGDEWAAYYGYPSFGVGFYTGFIGDPDVFGNPNALYGWMNFPITNGERRNIFSINPALGLTYNLAPYDPRSNPDNDAIGGKMAVYFNLAFQFAYRLTREMDLNYGVDFTHFSNGRTLTPNWGLNMFGINVGLLYHYNADQHRVTKDPFGQQVLQSRFRRSTAKAPEKIRESSIEVYLAAGTTQTYEEAGSDIHYFNFSGALDYVYRFDTIHAATVGFDYFYDESLSYNFPDSSDHYLIGVHAGYDFNFWKMLVRLQVGTYLTDDRNKGPVFIRPAIRYKINDWMFAQVGLKTQNSTSADWVEWGIGFRPFRW